MNINELPNPEKQKADWKVTYGINSMICHPGKGHIMENKISAVWLVALSTSHNLESLRIRVPVKEYLHLGWLAVLSVGTVLIIDAERHSPLRSTLFPWQRVLELNIRREMMFACIFPCLSALDVVWPTAFKLPLLWTPLSVDCNLELWVKTTHCLLFLLGRFITATGRKPY